jgi:hypothetical protein
MVNCLNPWPFAWQIGTPLLKNISFLESQKANNGLATLAVRSDIYQHVSLSTDFVFPFHVNLSMLGKIKYRELTK